MRGTFCEGAGLCIQINYQTDRACARPGHALFFHSTHGQLGIVASFSRHQCVLFSFFTGHRYRVIVFRVPNCFQRPYPMYRESLWGCKKCTNRGAETEYKEKNERLKRQTIVQRSIRTHRKRQEDKEDSETPRMLQLLTRSKRRYRYCRQR